MAKICIFEIGAKVIDTNSEEYTNLYQDWYESENETVALFYEKSDFKNNFVLGKNSHLISEKIQDTFYDIKLRLDERHPRKYSDSTSSLIKLSVLPGNILDAAKSKIDERLEVNNFFEELLSDSFDLKIDNNTALDLLKSHYESQKEKTGKNWYVNNSHHLDIKNTDWYNGFLNTYLEGLRPNNAEQDLGSSFALGLKAALDREIIDTPQNLEFAKGYAVGQLIVQVYLSRLTSAFENMAKNLQKANSIDDISSLFDRVAA